MKNLVLDQLTIPWLIFFFILITGLLILYSYCKEKFCPAGLEIEKILSRLLVTIKEKMVAKYKNAVAR